MRLISGKQMLEKARAEGYAVGAFSVHNAEMIQAVLSAAEEERAPVMLQIGQRVIQSVGMEAMMRLVESIGKSYDVEVSVHLDHSNRFEQVMKALQLSFQSVMYDGSHLPLDENIANTKQVAKAAHALGVSVEGELGRIAGTEDDITVLEEEAMLTDPEEAVRFVEETDVDYLAVAIGTAHGFYKGEPKIHFERLEQISRAVRVPLVLHGGSGVPDQLVQRAIRFGIAKVNVDTELRCAFVEGLQFAFKHNPQEYHLSELYREAKKRLKEKVKEKIKCFGSSGRANLR